MEIKPKFLGKFYVHHSALDMGIGIHDKHKIEFQISGNSLIPTDVTCWNVYVILIHFRLTYAK